MISGTEDERDFGRYTRKSVRQLDVKLVKFEAINYGVRADKISTKVPRIFPVVDDEISTVSTSVDSFLHEEVMLRARS